MLQWTLITLWLPRARKLNRKFEMSGRKRNMQDIRRLSRILSSFGRTQAYRSASSKRQKSKWVLPSWPLHADIFLSIAFGLGSVFPEKGSDYWSSRLLAHWRRCSESPQSDHRGRYCWLHGRLHNKMFYLDLTCPQLKENKRELKLELVDVGGQRGERRRWIHCFEGVTAGNQYLLHCKTCCLYSFSLSFFSSVAIEEYVIPL